MQFPKLDGKWLLRLRLARVAAITLATVLVCGYLDQFTQIFDLLEQKTYGERLEVMARKSNPVAARARQQIVLVTIADTSFDPSDHSLPPGPLLPRADQAQVIRELTQAGAQVIAFDLLFDTKQDNDDALAESIRKSPGRVLLACGDKGLERPQILPPEQRLLNAGARRGHTRMPMELDRPAINRLEPVILDRAQPVIAFSVEAVRMASGLPDQPPHRTVDGWQISGLPVPTDSDGTFRIRYLGSPGKTFRTFPYEDILHATPAQASFYQSIFAHKIVLVGDTTRIDKDNYLTPLGEMPGVEVQANAVATLLTGTFIHEAPWTVNLALLLGLASFAALLASVWRLRRAVLFLALLLPAYFLFNVWMFVERDVFLHLVAQSTVIILTALGVLLERGLTEEQEKTRMHGLLQRYVSPQISGYLLQHPELLGRAGKRVTGTVLFSDIRGFTALSEGMPPEELVSRMNEYFEAMTDIVFRHDGTVVSMVGDAMLALFGVPAPYSDHARRAVAAAIDMQDALTDLQEKWRAQDRQVFSIGIGINTGEMVVGDVGGRQIMNFTVYGLQVNIASRVEGLNKDLGSSLLITRATYQAVAEEIAVRGPLQAPVKGVEDALEVFEVLGWRREVMSAPVPALTE